MLLHGLKCVSPYEFSSKPHVPRRYDNTLSQPLKSYIPICGASRCRKNRLKVAENSARGPIASSVVLRQFSKESCLQHGTNLSVERLTAVSASGLIDVQGRTPFYHGSEEETVDAIRAQLNDMLFNSSQDIILKGRIPYDVVHCAQTACQTDINVLGEVCSIVGERLSW